MDVSVNTINGCKWRISEKFWAGILLLSLVCLTLSSCGGGGGSSASPNITPESSSETPSRNSSYNFANQPALKTIKADRAWAKIRQKYGANTAAGSGYTLGAIDSGIDSGHSYFAGKKIDEVFLLDATDEDGSTLSHGTAVASTMVGSPNDLQQGARGVAWGADITMFAIPVGSRPNPKRFTPVSLSYLSQWNQLTNWPKVVNDAVTWSNNGRSLDFVNVSLGFHGMIDLYSEADLTANFNNVINAIKQSGSNNKTVFVWSAGNGHGQPCDPSEFPNSHRHLCTNGRVNAVSPNVQAGLPARFPELKANLIAVVAVDGSGNIASFSNRCGIAMDSCIAAPGTNINVAYFGPDIEQNPVRGTTTGNGTSFAAPLVTGGLGIMKHYFRNQLSNTALVTRLYATANKSGIYANKQIYGQGLMDHNAAVSPVGSTTLRVGNQVKDSVISLDSTWLNLSSAFGDSLTQSFSNQEIVAFDQLGAPFWYSLGATTRTLNRPSIQSRLKQFMKSTYSNGREFGVFRPALGTLSTRQFKPNSDRLSIGFMDTPDFLDDGGHLALLGQAIALNRPISDESAFSLFSTEGGWSKTKSAGMEFASRPFKSPIPFRMGIVAERESLLRSSASGAFGRMSGNSAFIGL